MAQCPVFDEYMTNTDDFADILVPDGEEVSKTHQISFSFIMIHAASLIYYDNNKNKNNYTVLQ